MLTLKLLISCFKIKRLSILILSVHDDIIYLLSKLSSSHFSDIFRETNGMTHACAHYICSTRSLLRWVGAPSPVVGRLISTLCNV